MHPHYPYTPNYIYTRSPISNPKYARSRAVVAHKNENDISGGCKNETRLSDARGVN